MGKEVCKVVPKVEEKSEDVELCHIEPEKVCEEKEVEVPKHVCEDEDSDDESGGVEAVKRRRGRKGRKGKKNGGQDKEGGKEGQERKRGKTWPAKKKRKKGLKEELNPLKIGNKQPYIRCGNVCK